MKKVILFLGIAAMLFACSGESSSSNTDTFDRKGMLENWADNIIIPSFQNYQSKTSALATASATFTTTPTEANLTALRASWLEAYKAYQKVAAFEVGKAHDLMFRYYNNSFPVSVSDINANIAAGDNQLDLLTKFDEQGFPALDYLLFGVGNDTASILAKYTTDTNAAKYKSYLMAVSTRIKSFSDLIVADWTTGGYRTAYVLNNGTGVSSSTNKTINLFVQYYEYYLRSVKIGFPAGKFSATTRPSDVEAYYKNDISKELLEIGLQSSKDFFNGKHFNSTTTGLSLKAYLDYLNVVRSGESLSTTILSKYAEASTSIGVLNASFSQQIQTDNTKMLAAFDALQKNVVCFKIDMIPALNVVIDYQDNDGD
ncbi:imelysin family protein [Flavobacterium sp. K5-23]|uniref:imelysin family protein n=1 Tax=Flavobacterium sp. K5-23 TaxID=2746225 RepID=UPI00200C3E3C|nr:imelysin family protein [Flavobacterium sp. K5-23]UQD55663.1 imelysin family protein [Flavobacterium sp. K5-23]